MKQLVMCLIVFFSLFTSCSDNSHYFRIKRGKFQATLTETGELQAVNSRVVVMPYLGWEYGRPILGKLVAEGTVVSAGDTVAWVEASGIHKFLVEKKNELEIARAEARNLQVKHYTQLEKLDGDLASMQSALTLAQVQAEKTRFESERKTRKSQLELEKATISYEKTRGKMEMTKIIQENELKIQSLKIFTLENAIKSAESSLTKAVLIAPINGLVEYKENRRTDQKVRAGDQLWPGSAIVGIPDLSKMKVLATVNETDIEKIKLHQKVIVRLDAFPDVPFNGTITEVAKLCHRKKGDSRIKLFDIMMLLEKSDPMLKPGMTVSCEVFTAEIDDGYFIENECIHKEDKNYYLFVKKKTGLEKQEIKIGARNNKFTVIYGNIKQGQRIAAKSGGKV